MENTQEKTPRRPSPGHQLRMPVQSAPIHRSSTDAGLTGDAGVEPAFWGSLLATTVPIAIDLAKKYL